VSTLYGFIALGRRSEEPVVGRLFNQQMQNTCLGGEVDNPNWRQQWTRQVVYDEEAAKWPY